MADTGSALMGIGQASGENKAADAVKAAISSPLLEYSIEGAKGVVFTISGGNNLSMFDVSESAKMINSLADKDAKIVFGAVIDESLGDDLKITIVATGFNDKNIKPSKKVEPEKKKEVDFMSDIGRGFVSEKKNETEQDNKKSIFNFNSKNIFHKEKIEEIDEEDSGNIRGRSINKNEKIQNDEESELDVPAFIRNKINK